MTRHPLLSLTEAQAEALVPTIRGKLTEAQCIEQGHHELLAELYHEHAPDPADVRREAARIRAWRGSSDESGHCRHGVYVGGIGIDWMCGQCESMDQWAEADDLEAYAAQLDETEEVPNRG